jgi:hypothetical protein
LPIQYIVNFIKTNISNQTLVFDHIPSQTILQQLKTQIPNLKMSINIGGYLNKNLHPMTLKKIMLFTSNINNNKYTYRNDDGKPISFIVVDLDDPRLFKQSFPNFKLDELWNGMNLLEYMMDKFLRYEYISDLVRKFSFVVRRKDGRKLLTQDLRDVINSNRMQPFSEIIKKIDN